MIILQAIIVNNNHCRTENPIYSEAFLFIFRQVGIWKTSQRGECKLDYLCFFVISLDCFIKQIHALMTGCYGYQNELRKCTEDIKRHASHK